MQISFIFIKNNKVLKENFIRAKFSLRHIHPKLYFELCRINTDEKRISLLRSWGGQDLVNFMKLHAKVLFEPITVPGEADTPKDTYAQIVTKIRTEQHPAFLDMQKLQPNLDTSHNAINHFLGKH